MKQKHLLSKLLLLVAVFVMGAGTTWAEDVTVFEEDFSQFTASSTNALTSFTSGNYGSWSDVANVYKEVGYIKFSSSSKKGKMTTPALTNLDGDATLTFKLGKYSNKTGTLKITINNAGKINNESSLSFSTANLSQNGWDSSYSIAITNGTPESTITFESTSERFYLDDIKIVASSGSSDPSVATTVTIDDTGITNTNIYEGTAAGTLTATVTAGETTVDGATVTWSTEDTGVATVDATSGAVTLVGAGTATITASYAGVEGEYKSSSANYELTVTNNDPNAPGTKNNPYTVADARAAIDANTGITGVYATGIVSEIVTAYNSGYGNITFDIIDAGGTNTLRAYRCTGDEASDVQVGDVVVVSGDLTLYNSEIYEFKQGCQLVSLTHPAATVCADPVFSPAAGTYTAAQSVVITCATEDATIYYTTDDTEPSATNGTAYTEAITVGSNMTIKAIAVKDGLDNSSVVSAAYVIDLTPVITAADVELEYDATSGEIAYSVTNAVEGKTLSAITTAEWISDITVTADKVTFTTTANESTENRTATITLSYEGATDVNVTVTQKHYVVDYAELPFEFNGGKGAIANTTGLTQNGLGSDYATAPYLKFDSTGDWVVLKFNERPGTLTFDYNTYSFSGGTFKIQESADGVNYSDVKTFSGTMGGPNYSTITNLDENTRYIKWVYTEKDNGNVAIGNIKLEKYVAPSTEPSITVDPLLVEAPAAGADGTIAVTYSYITNVAAEVYFCNAEGAAATYDWIVADINAENNVYYVINNNDGDARTAYMKVYALGDNTEDVYSELITINQAAYVPTLGNFVKVTSTADITSGQYLIVYEDGGVAFDGSRNDSDDKLDAVGNTINVTIENDMIAATTTNAKSVFNIDVTAGTLQSASGKYIGVSGNSNGLKTSDDAETYTHTFSIDEGEDAVIAANFDGSSMTLRYNYASNQARFRYYKDNGQQAIQLYKFVPDAADATVSVTDAGYATYCSDKDLDFSNTAIKAYKAKITGSEVNFTEVKQVRAGEGVLLKADEGTYSVPVAAYAAANTDNVFIGVTEPTLITETGIFVLMNGNKGVGFYKTTTAFTVGANTAYLPASAGAARTFIGFDDAVTAIEGIAAEKMLNGEVYNLQGQRVVKAQKGLYIMNGKKVLVK